jgi:hypothetical protein
MKVPQDLYLESVGFRHRFIFVVNYSRYRDRCLQENYCWVAGDCQDQPYLTCCGGGDELECHFMHIPSDTSGSQGTCLRDGDKARCTVLPSYVST